MNECGHASHPDSVSMPTGSGGDLDVLQKLRAAQNREKLAQKEAAIARAEVIHWLASHAEQSIENCQDIVNEVQRRLQLHQSVGDDAFHMAPPDGFIATPSPKAKTEPFTLSTVMLRNVPANWDVEVLRQELFWANLVEGVDVDCICLCRMRQRVVGGSTRSSVPEGAKPHRGYAFVNVTSEHAKETLMAAFDGRQQSADAPAVGGGTLEVPFGVTLAKNHGVDFYQRKHPNESMTFARRPPGVQPVRKPCSPTSHQCGPRPPVISNVAGLGAVDFIGEQHSAPDALDGTFLEAPNYTGQPSMTAQPQQQSQIQGNQPQHPPAMWDAAVQGMPEATEPQVPRRAEANGPMSSAETARLPAAATPDAEKDAESWSSEFNLHLLKAMLQKEPKVQT